MTGGVCGGVWDGDNRFSVGGAFATNQITGTYVAGQTISVTVGVVVKNEAFGVKACLLSNSGKG